VTSCITPSAWSHSEKHGHASLARWDIPFANLYLLDAKSKHAILASTTGLNNRGGLLCPELVTLTGLKRLSYAFYRLL
jgi:hypothetical protein